MTLELSMGLDSVESVVGSGHPTVLRSSGPRVLGLGLSPIYSDTTQLNWTSSWVELCRYKWGFRVVEICV